MSAYRWAASSGLFFGSISTATTAQSLLLRVLDQRLSSEVSPF